MIKEVICNDVTDCVFKGIPNECTNKRKVENFVIAACECGDKERDFLNCFTGKTKIDPVKLMIDFWTWRATTGEKLAVEWELFPELNKYAGLCAFGNTRFQLICSDCKFYNNDNKIVHGNGERCFSGLWKAWGAAEDKELRKFIANKILNKILKVYEKKLDSK